jgi:hypothetical protein
MNSLHYFFQNIFHAQNYDEYPDFHFKFIIFILHLFYLIKC